MNVAIHKQAVQSTTKYGAVANRAVDGNTGTNYYDNSCTHTKERLDSPWWRVDLGKEVWSRKKFRSDFLKQLKIHV